jgi:hypothetical protein
MRKFHYRAWKLDNQGNPKAGITEELLARSLAEASRKAWQRAAKYLADYAPIAIHMEHITEGPLPGITE